jgi:hypothetical protein
MALANDDDVIKTFPSDRADQPLRSLPIAATRRMNAAPYDEFVANPRSSRASFRESTA